MVTQFVPVPIAWELKVAYDAPIAQRRGYSGWKSVAFPVIGWEYQPVQYNATPDGRTVDAELEAWISYKGVPTPTVLVLDALRREALERAQSQGLQAHHVSISYELAPA